MSGKKRQRIQRLMEERQHAARRQRRRWITAIATVVTLIIMAVTWHSRRSVTSDAHQTAAKSLVADEKWTVQALLALKPNQLEGMDIALVNLLCAEGLRGSEKLDVDMALDRLDEFATRVRVETDRNMHRFNTNRAEYQNSKPYFRMLMLVTVLQQDFGIRYNPARVTPVGVFEPNDKFFADSRDVFLHGITGEPGMGTCSSLPVLYVAVGRRLRYPLSLVSAKNHLFVRWEDRDTRLNIEAASIGMNTYDDAHYRAWPYMIARGWDNGRYPNKRTGTNNHTAIYLGPGSKPGSIKILSQNDEGASNGRFVGTTEESSDGWNIVTANVKSDEKPTQCTLEICTKDGIVKEKLTIDQALKLYNLSNPQH